MHSPDIAWANANLSHSAAQRSKHQQFSEQVSLSLWPSFFLHSQSLHLCLTIYFPLPWPAGASPSFILILFHASSFSCLVLIHHHPHPVTALPPHYHLHHTPSSIQLGHITDATFTGPPCWHTPLWLITSSDPIWHSSHPNISIAIPLRHIRKAVTPISHVLFHNRVTPCCWSNS